MEAIVFVGIQAAGKTSFYRERFFRTHIRLSLDMLRTRHERRSCSAPASRRSSRLWSTTPTQRLPSALAT